MCERGVTADASLLDYCRLQRGDSASKTNHLAPNLEV